MLGFMAMAIFAIVMGLSCLMLAGMWMIFGKAGRSQWVTLMPLYNSWVLYTVAGKPGWWSFVSLIPVAGWIVLAYMSFGLAAKFGKSRRFAIFMIFLPPVAYATIGFGKAQYDQT